MRLTKVFVRFYKSFNYDYERKYRGDASSADPWEMIDDAWYPFVTVGLEPSITTIVGANESGKSHLLDAIRKVITGEAIDYSDFCRYSHFFSVEMGQRRRPDFGCEFEVDGERDIKAVSQSLKVETNVGDKLLMFRLNGADPVVYHPGAVEPIKGSIDQKKIAAMLPAVFTLDAHRPLPDSIPIAELQPTSKRSWGSRSARRKIDELTFGKPWENAEALKAIAGDLFSIVSSSGGDSNPNEELERQYQLARDLLFKVGNIEPEAFKELSDAIEAGNEGYANSLIQQMNTSLATHLNFRRWWAQDQEFSLLVSRSDFDIVFTIRDRTGTEYSFAERSNGLKYFLSYHVQLLAHRPPLDGQAEILTMDEPDAYLSSQGQQDLLRILEEFAVPEDASRRDQVVYVTHSPFLINRNAATRIRVLDKGVSDEGTRVVKDVARNHYEPLRSALGAFVAETSFIGGSNLFVEGAADQVLLAGTSSLIRAQGQSTLDTLDLNTVTIVPAGSASSVPYLVYLARGRDEVKPPCVALLDSDTAGNEAASLLRKGGPRNKEILGKDFIVQVGEWTKSKGVKVKVADEVVVRECEDLIALPVAVDAARNYAVHFLGLDRDAKASQLTELDITAKLSALSGSLFDALAAAFAERFGDGAHIDKVGFAKEVVAALNEARRKAELPDGYEDTQQNFRLLLRHLAAKLRAANTEEQDRRLNSRLKRVVAGFLADYPRPTTRENGKRFLDDVEMSIEKTDAGDQIRLQAERMRRDFDLEEDLTRPIENFDEFRERVKGIKLENRLVNQDDNVVVRRAETPAAAAETPADADDPSSDEEQAEPELEGRSPAA